MSPDNYEVVGEYSDNLEKLFSPEAVTMLGKELDPVNQIEEVIKNFDFRKCNRICKLLKWKYDLGEKYKRVPSELEMRNIVRELMHQVIYSPRVFMGTNTVEDYCFMATYNGAIVKLYYVMVSA